MENDSMKGLAGLSLRAPVEYVTPASNLLLHHFRSPFTRDRDRIFFSDSFRRLSGKTQLFTAQYNDQTRTRLTHTLEVSQIARIVAGWFNLDLDLTEAIALGHDLGHPPFGHTVERTLNHIMNGCLEEYNSCFSSEVRGFKHNLQSVRILTHLEQPIRKEKNRGLNITNFTLYGIWVHTSEIWKKSHIHDDNTNMLEQGALHPTSNCDFKLRSGHCTLTCNERKCTVENLSVGHYNLFKKHLFLPGENKRSWSFEAFIVAIADEIAQRHHDIEDGFRNKLINRWDIDNSLFKPLERFAIDDTDQYYLKQARSSIKTQNAIVDLSKFIINLYLNQLIKFSSQNLEKFIKKHNIKTQNDWIDVYPAIDEVDAKKIIDFNPEFKETDDKLKENLLKKRIINSMEVQRMNARGRNIAEKLFRVFLNDTRILPDLTIYRLKKYLHWDETEKTWIELLGRNWSDQEIIAKIVSDFRCDLRSNHIFLDSRAKEELMRTICDHIAGMTDAYAIEQYHSICD